jgi:hypothetical protein
MVAVEAMEYGMRLMYALTHQQREQQAQLDPHQRLITDYFDTITVRRETQQALPASHKAARMAAAWFWCLLQDFVHLQAVPRSWANEVLADHPFIGLTQGNNQSNRLILNLPPGITLPRQI